MSASSGGPGPGVPDDLDVEGDTGVEDVPDLLLQPGQLLTADRL